MAIKLDYYHSTADFVRYLFYRVPKILFEAVELRGISFDARMFFIFLLDRANLSAQNGWIDETGRIYIFFTLSAAMWITGYGHNKTLRLFTELEEAGLIERVRQGLGKPMKIYVKNLFNPTDEDGNPVEYQRVSLSPSEARMESQMSFFADMDAAEMRTAENEPQNAQDRKAETTIERTAANQVIRTAEEIKAEAETVLETEDTLDADRLALREYYAEIGLSPEGVADMERSLAAMSPKDAALIRSIQLAEYARLSREREQNDCMPETDTSLPVAPCNEEKASAEDDVDNVEKVESCGKLSTFVENSDSEYTETDAFDASAPLCAAEKGKSGLPETGSLDFRKPESNQNKNNNNNFTKNPSYPPSPFTGREPSPDAGKRRTRRRRTGEEWMEDMRNCKEEVREQIGFHDLCGKHSADVQTLRFFVDLIAGVLCSRDDVIKVNGELHPVEEVQARFALLDREHIDYVLECLGKTTSEIHNLRAYLITTFYNAPGSIAAYYDARVRHDMAQPSWYETPYSRRAS